MIRWILNPIRSLMNLLWIVVRETTRATGALLRGDLQVAGEHARVLYLSAHADLLKGVVTLQRVLPLWRKTGPNIDRILIVKLDRIGDMVVGTAVLDALRELYPKARLDVVGHPVPLTLLEGDPRVGERLHYRSWLYHPLWVLPPGLRSCLLLVKLLWRRYPLVVYLRGSIPMLLLGITSRLAATRFIWAEPVGVRNMKALRSACGPVRDFAPRLHVSPENAEFARRLLRGGDGSPARPRVTIHPGANAEYRMWPPERFAALADQLSQRFGAVVHFLGSPADRPMLEKIAGLTKASHSYHWSLRLPQAVAVVAESDVLVGNDSGLVHVAAAVGTPAVVIWGAANLSMSHPIAPPEDCIVLYHDIPCRDHCVEFRCKNPNERECLRQIQTGDVVASVARLLYRNTPEAMPAGRLGVGARFALPCLATEAAEPTRPD